MSAQRRGQSLRRQQASWTLAITGAGGCAAAVATYLHLPGAAVLWLALLVAAWTEEPAVLTGRRDESGFPTPAHPGEQRSLRRYRLWSYLRWRLLLPNPAWLPGWPPLASTGAAVALGLGAWCLPVSPLVPAAEWINAAAAFVVCTTVTAARRVTAPEGPDCPGNRVDTLPALLGGRRGRAVAGVAATVAAVAAGLVLVFAPTVGEWAPPSRPLTALAAGLVAVTVVVARPWQVAALADWRELCHWGAIWEDRWKGIRMDPAPALTGHRMVGPAVVDEFAAPTGVGAQAFWPLAAKIAPSVGAGHRVAILELPDTDRAGQPIPGSRHPLRFQVVSWPVADPPDLSDPTTPDPVAHLYARCAFAWTTDALGYGRAVLVDVEKIARTGDGPAPESEPQRQHDSPECANDGGIEGRPDLDDDGDPAGSTTARASWWAFPGGPSLTEIRRALLNDLAANFGCQVLIDHRRDILYFGALTEPTTDYTEPDTAVTMANLAREDHWNFVWSQVLKQDANPPTIQHATLATHRLRFRGRPIVLNRVGFVTLQGLDPTEYFGLEAKLATALNAAPFVSVTGWPAPAGSPGSRHPQAFAVAWSEGPVPDSPAELDDDGVASMVLLAGLVNRAFAAARLARPEVDDARILTTPGSRGHIWEVTVRLYGGVTLADVRGAAARLQRELRVPWLRITPAEPGCTIFAGELPAPVDLAQPRRDRLRLVRLDWHQAFVEAKVTGNNALVPDLTASGTLPRNERVGVLDFLLPPGLDLARVRAGIDKLRVATGNDFVDVRPGPTGASSLRLLVSPTNPLPPAVDFDFDAADRAEGIVFATGVDGEPVAFNPAESPHLLVAGSSGSGKSVLIQALLYGAVARHADVVVVDPIKGGADFRFVRPWARGFATDLAQAAAVMKAIHAIVMQRKEANAAAGVGSYRDLPDPPTPIYLFIDEFTSLMEPETVPKPSDDPDVEVERDRIQTQNLARQTIGVLTGRLAREARSAGVSLVLGTQKLSGRMLDSIPGAGDLKTQVARILLGKASYGDRASALRVPDDAPGLPGDIPKGRGLFEPLTSSAVAVQTWFATQSQLRADLDRRRPPLRPDEVLDLGPFLAKNPPPDDDPGSVIEPAGQVTDLADLVFELTDLADASELVTDEAAAHDPPPDLAVDEAQAAPQHDPRVPVGGTVDRPDALVCLDVGALTPMRHRPSTTSPGAVMDVAAALRRGYDGADPAQLPADAMVVIHAGSMNDPDAADLDATVPGGATILRDDRSPGPGWWKLDRLQRHLSTRPRVRRIVWLDGELAQEDGDLGVTHAELAGEMLLRTGIAHLLIPIPRDGPTAGEIEAALAFLGAGHRPDRDDEESSEATGPKAGRPAGPEDDPFARRQPSGPGRFAAGRAVHPDEDPFAGPGHTRGRASRARAGGSVAVAADDPFMAGRGAPGMPRM